ncbi:MAG: hypothetical protein CO108_14950 [Deltaproteobacteria bacterium CG_4_9_14_3_um_filter_63_12]|nr:MAG: hypothetical protein CO108_14950 [Deltaproteobacteria bacterium CG_4_9_14_3_um_filter_63_12]
MDVATRPAHVQKLLFKAATVWAFALLCFLWAPSFARAQDAPALPDAGATDLSGNAGADLGFGKLGDDTFLSILLAANFAIDELSFGLQVPLRLRMIDEEPTDGDGVEIRDEDWDEASDYLRIIRFIQWAKPGEVFYARVGELSGATVGHGTLMSNYLNVLDIDHYQLGVDTKVNTLYGGGELVLDNLAQPEIFGGRAFVRPWSFVDAESFLLGWSVGLSLLTDLGAPRTIDSDPATNVPLVDKTHNLQYTTEAVVMLGFDTDFTVLENEIVRVTPYIDNNVLAGLEAGYGLHVGVLTDVTLPADTTLNLRLEYQYLGESYAPQYVDPLYEIQRVAFPNPRFYGPDTLPLTKQAVVREAVGAHGYLGQMTVSPMGLVKVSALYRGSQRKNDNDLLLQLLVPTLAQVKVGVLYSKTGFDSFSDAFDPQGALFQAYARYNVYLFIDLIAQFNRRWRLVTEVEDPNFGNYEGVDEWSFGVGASFDF